MPETTSTTSEPEDDGSSDLSVLDFLYHDARRIGSFLSQFEGGGHLQQLTLNKTGARGRTKSHSQDVKIGGKLLGGTEQEKIDNTVSSNEGMTRVFDPYWANARAFLDFVSEHDMLQTDINRASVGQFVIAKGYLSVLDLAMLKDAWKLPAIQKQTKNGALSKPIGQMTAKQKAEHREQSANSDLMIEMMQVLPHSVHAWMLAGGEQTALAWAALREEYLTTPASELTLTHGASMPGKWSMVGILTSLPNYAGTSQPSALDGTEIGVFQSLIGELSKQLAPIVKFMLGRPSAAYAMTPLLIFREIGAHDDDLDDDEVTVEEVEAERADEGKAEGE